MDGISFGGALSFAQFERIQRGLLPWWMRTWIVVPFVVYAFAFNGRSIADIVDQPIVTMLCLALAMGVLLLIWGLLRFSRRRAWKRAVALNGSVAGSAGAEGISWNTELTQTRFPWTKVTKLRKCPDLVLLFYAPRCALYFPREFFASEEAWHAFGALAAAQLARAD